MTDDTVIKPYETTAAIDDQNGIEPMTGDAAGAVTQKDASYIQKYINFAEILEEPKTWAEIIKK